MSRIGITCDQNGMGVISCFLELLDDSNHFDASFPLFLQNTIEWPEVEKQCFLLYSKTTLTGGHQDSENTIEGKFAVFYKKLCEF